MSGTDYTEDSLFNGRILVRQPRHGYRFSVDALLLAGQVPPTVRGKLADLGTGCGIIPLILAERNPLLKIWAVEIQPELAELAAQNANLNQWGERITVLVKDMRAVTLKDTRGPVDWVVSNPPFRKASSGRINPNPQRAMARHELSVNMNQVVTAAGRLLRIGGKFDIIFLADRLADLLMAMRARGLEPKQMRTVHSFPSSDARLVLVRGVRGARPGFRVLPPLILYDRGGDHTAEMKALLAFKNPGADQLATAGHRPTKG